ncbi:transcription intermediary factor 1-alpha-like [Mytilus trossulus]|uniref:transcription intermediary factor 1-alpha-like n=1 Tax=Mytilus trossulus TaxID=6551 RepID=UPI003005AA90
MASKSLDTFCGTCERRSRNTKAVKYCTDCEDGFCSECLDFHENMKVATSHHIIDIKVVDEITFNISKFCKVHSDMALEYFCSDHDTLCCRSCMASDHRACDKLLPIEVAAKGVKSSAMYEEIVTDVGTLNAAIIELGDQREKNISSLDNSKVTVQQEVQYFQKSLQTRIQEVGVALMSEIDKVHTDLSDKAKGDMDKICDRKKHIQNISEQFESVSKHGSDSLIVKYSC